MRSSLTWALALTGTATAAAVSPTATTKAPSSTSKADSSACGLAKAAAEKYFLAEPSATAALIAPSLAYNCLKSVTIDKENDLDLLNYLEPYIEFQSTLEPLANPPEGYLIPGVDVIKGLGQIRAKLSSNQYKSQVDFAAELKYLFFQASDGHFAYNPAILNIFGFKSINGLVSVADESSGLPRIYLFSDFNKYLASDTDVYDIESIDGVPVVDFLEAMASIQLTQDPDAKYNALFTNPASAAKKSSGSFTRRHPGCPDQEVIKFTNGTTFTNKLWATVSAGIVDVIGSPESLHEEFELPSTPSATPEPTTAPAASSTVKATPTPTPTQPTQLTGYPKPVSFHAHEWISGYFLDGDYKDTAVLAILSFSPWGIPESQINGTFEIQEAGRTVAEFLKKAKDAGKKKLIIDVQTNGGGFIAAGFQLYNQLFPKTTDIWDGNRLRAHEALNAIGATAEKSSEAVYKDFIGTFLNEQDKPYKDWADLYGPEVVGGQNVTNLLRYDQQHFGYTPVKGENPFAAEDIVVVTDGICASTCTIFTGLLVREQGVRTIALGGRPLEAAMQAIGGVKGAQVLNFVDLRQTIMGVGKDAIADNNTKALNDAFDVLPDIGEPPLLPALASAGAFNYRNAYARKNVKGYPEQFIYESSNCKLSYTDKMVVDPVAVWSATYDAAWKKGKCVTGSTVNTDQTISDKTVAYNAKVVSKVKVYGGPGALSYKGAYEPPKPFVQKTQKRSIEDQLAPPEDFEYEFKHKIGDLKEYIENNVPEDFEYEQKHKWGFSHAIQI